MKGDRFVFYSNFCRLGVKGHSAKEVPAGKFNLIR